MAGANLEGSLCCKHWASVAPNALRLLHIASGVLPHSNLSRQSGKITEASNQDLSHDGTRNKQYRCYVGYAASRDLGSNCDACRDSKNITSFIFDLQKTSCLRRERWLSSACPDTVPLRSVPIYTQLIVLERCCPRIENLLKELGPKSSHCMEDKPSSRHEP